MKFIVIKKDDVSKYLQESEVQSLEHILNMIANGRSKDGKKAVNEYWVCNTDEPYAENVYRIIAEGEEKKGKIT